MTFCVLEDLWYVLNADDAECDKLPVGDEPSIAVASSANSVDEMLVLEGLTAIICLLATILLHQSIDVIYSTPEYPTGI